MNYRDLLQRGNVGKISVTTAVCLLIVAGIINSAREWLIIPGWSILAIWVWWWFAKNRYDMDKMAGWVMPVVALGLSLYSPNVRGNIINLISDPSFRHILQLMISAPFWFVIATYWMSAVFVEEHKSGEQIYDLKRDVEKGIFMDIDKYRPATWGNIEKGGMLFIFRPTATGPFEALEVIAKDEEQLETTTWKSIRKAEIDSGWAYRHVDGDYGGFVSYVKFGVAVDVIAKQPKPSAE